MTTVTSNSAGEENSTCANYPCNCLVQPGDKYCCDSCAKQQDGEVCSCGHSECQRE
jgi:hypothetical protein